MVDVVFRFSIAFLLEFPADFFRQPIDVATANRDLPYDFEDLSSHLKRLRLSRRLDDLPQGRRSVAVPVQFQNGTLREKNPGDTPGNEPSVPRG